MTETAHFQNISQPVSLLSQAKPPLNIGGDFATRIPTSSRPRRLHCEGKPQLLTCKDSRRSPK